MQQPLEASSDNVPPQISEAVISEAVFPDSFGYKVSRQPTKPILKKPELMNAIDAYRAQICADMRKEHGEKFGSFDACEEFMRKACHPGKDDKMDGDSGEISTAKGHCK